MVILCNSALLPAKFPSFPPHQEEEGWSRGAGRDQRRAPDRGRRGAKWGICLEEIGDLPQFYQGKLGIYHNFARETWMKMVTICDWGTMEIFSLRWENCVCFFQETRDLTGEMMIECWYNEDIGAYTTRNILCMYILYLYCHIYIYILSYYICILYIITVSISSKHGLAIKWGNMMKNRCKMGGSHDFQLKLPVFTRRFWLALSQNGRPQRPGLLIIILYTELYIISYYIYYIIFIYSPWDGSKMRVDDPSIHDFWGTMILYPKLPH